MAWALHLEGTDELCTEKGEQLMNLEIWIPGLLLLGLVGLGLMCAFIIGCEKV